MPDFESFFGCKPSASHTFKPVVPEHPLAEGTTWTLQTVDGDLRVTVSANDPEQLEELRQRAVTLGWEII